MTAPRLLLWCLAGASLVQLVIWRSGSGNPFGFSPIFWYLLTAYDTHGNILLFVATGCAFLLRRRPEVLSIVRIAAERPWTLAAAAFALLCLGSLRVYHDYPLSMDEYAAVFQARAFASGRLSGSFPPELLDWLIPPFFQNFFLRVSPSSGAVASGYWPGFALLLAPFAWLDIPWAANPAIGALTLPAVHRLARQVGGSQEAAGWALLLTAASPAFVVSSISYYSMPAHLLCNLLYALLLLRPTVARALLAGLLGSLALTLHQPVPHMLFCLPFLIWLAIRPGSRVSLAALMVGYLPLSLALGVGWHNHLQEVMQTVTPAVAAGAAGAPAPSPLDSLVGLLGAAVSLPHPGTIAARIAGLGKTWAWGCAGLMILAAYGYSAADTRPAVRALGASLLITFLGYFFFSQDQGHGWGYRYLHSAWFVMPVLASIALTAPQPGRAGEEVRAMAAWGLALSLVFANALRLAQVDAFMDRHLAQVPPLARHADPARPELVLVDIRSGFYVQDMVQNDPFLRGPRIVMVRSSTDRNSAILATRFPGYVKAAEGRWGELWKPGP